LADEKSKKRVVRGHATAKQIEPKPAAELALDAK
jgi:hypothetical protein